jgi:hypothetical protein
MFGSAARRDWVLLEVTGDDVRLGDVALDGSARRETTEQTHLLQLRGPSLGAVVERVRLYLPRLGPATGGDCVRLLGARDAWVERPRLTEVVGEVCDRSYVSVQRGVRDLLIERSGSLVVGDQALDLEPTGHRLWGCSPIIDGVVVRDSYLNTGHDGLAVAIAGDDCAVADRVVLDRVVIPTGTVSIINAGRVELRGMHLREVSVRRRLGSLRVVGSHLSRAASAGPGAVLRVSGTDDARPTEVLVIDSDLEQRTAAPVILAEHLESLVVVSSGIRYQGDPPPDQWAIDTRGGSAVVVDSLVRGGAGAVRTTGDYQPVRIRVSP